MTIPAEAFMEVPFRALPPGTLCQLRGIWMFKPAPFGNFNNPVVQIGGPNPGRALPLDLNTEVVSFAPGWAWEPHVEGVSAFQKAGVLWGGLVMTGEGPCMYATAGAQRIWNFNLHTGQHAQAVIDIDHHQRAANWSAKVYRDERPDQLYHLFDVAATPWRMD